MQTSHEAILAMENRLYFVGLGANLPSRAGNPLETLVAALAAMEARNINIVARSPWFESEPVPKSEQEWFINAVILVSGLENPYNMLKLLHEIEIEFGRVRSVPNAARPLDLDLLERVDRARIMPQSIIASGQGGDADLSGHGLVLPHPRLADRGFVLRPWQAIAPDWVHAPSGLAVAAMAARLPPAPVVRLLQA